MDILMIIPGHPTNFFILLSHPHEKKNTLYPDYNYYDVVYFLSETNNLFVCLCVVASPHRKTNTIANKIALSPVPVFPCKITFIRGAEK